MSAILSLVDDFSSLEDDSDNVVPFRSHEDEVDHVSNVRVFDNRKNANPVKGYMDAVSTVKQLTVEEEKDLITRAQKGDLKARNSLTMANLKLVAAIAKKYEDRGIPTIDLIQEGTIGLMNAVNKFDPKMGHRFSTYAAWWVREAITRSLSNKSRVVRLPVHLNELMTKVRRVRSTLAVKLGRQATTEEIANELGESVEKINKTLEASMPCFSLDQKLGASEDESCTLGDTIEDERSEHPVNEANAVYVNSQVAKLLHNLNPKERMVVSLRFGLETGSEASLREIATIMGLTRDQVGKISCIAMRKLKKAANRDEFEDYLAA